VRVFTPYIQYVDINLRGCAIQRRRIEVPKAIQGIAPTAEIQDRLRTTFELIEKSDELSSEYLENQLQDIRKNFTRALGKPYGRVLLRSQRGLFDARIAEFRKLLEAHKKRVQERLAATLAHSRQQLVEHFLPLAERKPPDALLGQLMSKPNRDQIRSWLDKVLSYVFPTPSDLITEMTFDVQFRDVTYETLKEDGFAEKLCKVYPQVVWDKPFSEFDAARERDSERTKEGESNA
jgi:hypothetical protein